MSQAQNCKLNSLKVGLSWSKAKKKVQSKGTASHSVSSAPQRSAIPTSNTERIFQDFSLPRRLPCKGQALIQDHNTACNLGHNGETAKQCSNTAQYDLLPEEDTEQGLVITLDDEQPNEQKTLRKKSGGRRRRDEEVSEAPRPRPDQARPMEVEIDQQLDWELESKSRQHNLTTVNVRNIIHEVITNEHVVAMMKAAIAESEAMPIFEPKMTRSKLKEVVERGVVIPTWNISPIKKPERDKPPQFVDIPLEEEDSSDEEYCPDEEEEDETAEETLLESDMESTASSPRGSRAGPTRAVIEYDEECSSSPTQGEHQSRHLQVEVVPMGPPPPPQPLRSPSHPMASSECSFMEKLHAVEQELATGPVSMEPFQALNSNGGHGNSLMAFRTRSKRPLRDVPLGQLEAELRAPDITPDMYECDSGPEDREWAQWLQGLMASDVENEEEADDDDDPEYNFLEDIDEPDLEDYRNDRAVRITKKEVNELMEELFETFHDDLGVQDVDEELHEEEQEKDEAVPAAGSPKFNIPQAIRFEEPLVHLLKEQHRTVKEQLEALRRRRALLGSLAPPLPVVAPAPSRPLTLSHIQKQQLQQQVQQHTQLLLQVHMLSRQVVALQSEADTTRVFLSELQMFAQRSEQAQGTMKIGFVSAFRACNLQGALSLLEELTDLAPLDTALSQLRHATSACSYPVLPAQLAWLLATRPVFLYPELLPHRSVDPSQHPPRLNTIYTRGEESLLVQSLRNFSETVNPYQLMCQYLLITKSPRQIRRRIHDMCQPTSPANIVKFFYQHKKVPRMLLPCSRVTPEEQCPPVEREEMVLPMWLRKSLPHIFKVVEEYNHQSAGDITVESQRKGSYTFPSGTHYPPSLPETLTLRPAGFRCLRQSAHIPKASVCQISAPASVNSATLSSERQVVPPCAEDRVQQMPQRKLCPIQPAPPKPQHQLLTMAVSGALNVLDLTGKATVGNVCASSGSEMLSLAPGQGCASGSPAVVISLVTPVSAPIISPAPAHSKLTGTESALLIQEPVSCFASSLDQSYKLPQKTPPSNLGLPTQTLFFSPLPLVPPATTLQPNPNLIPSTVPMCNRTELPVTPSFHSVHAISTPAQRCSKNSPSHSIIDEVVASPGRIWPSCPAFLGQTEVLDVPDARVDFTEVPCTPGSPSQDCYILSGPQSSMASEAIGLKQAVNQAKVQHISALQGTREHWISAATASPRNHGISPTPDTLGYRKLTAGSPSKDCPSHWEDKRWDEEEVREEEEGHDYGGLLLALSESSMSPHSSLDSHSDTLQRTSDAKWLENGRLGDGDRNRKAVREREGMQWKENIARGAIAEDGQSGRGGHNHGQVEDCEDRPEDDDEEAMSSASEKSVLSVPELQETMDKLSWLASESRLHEDSDSQEDKYLQSSSHLSTSCAITTSIYQNFQLEEEVELNKGGPVLLPVREASLVAGLTHTFDREKDHVDNYPLMERKHVALAQLSLNQFEQQLESSIGDAPSCYQEVLAVLQGSHKLSSTGRKEMKAHISKHLKGRPCLQKEFWTLFNKHHPSPLHHSQPEEATERLSLEGAKGFFKLSPVKSRSNIEKLSIHRNKKSSRVVKSHYITSIPTKAPLAQTHPGEGKWGTELKGARDRVLPHTEENKEERMEQVDGKVSEGRGESENPPGPKRAHRSPLADPVLPAKNISLTPSGEKVIVWTRETDRLILLTCQKQGANWNTFQALSAQLGNKSASEVAKRFRNLLHLFHAISKLACSENQPSTEERPQKEPD
ncbi:GON-4-like protein isoform X1 [Brienomyrus brachyistius]|uniref:GON-4-like protein isoform X1 n=1 Tax=Brienomyrus brachyistius TaxID=42636 RepID=UPI0020B198BF|nr:GON-4-like protein isoform X1 [Brienomyrus brachyistius]XP_048849208.1 GON-4-like protein isoform X1 [Brienomyrus brachyistius]